MFLLFRLVSRKRRTILHRLRRSLCSRRGGNSDKNRWLLFNLSPTLVPPMIHSVILQHRDVKCPGSNLSTSFSVTESTPVSMQHPVPWSFTFGLDCHWRHRDHCSEIFTARGAAAKKIQLHYTNYQTQTWLHARTYSGISRRRLALPRETRASHFAFSKVWSP